MHKVDIIVLEIQSGKSELIATLWDEIYGYIRWSAQKRLALSDAYHRQFLDDMIQESYFQMIKTLEHFIMPTKESSNSSFLNLLSYYLRVSFTNVLEGGHSKKKKLNPLNSAISLDASIRDEDTSTLSETLIDFDSQAAFIRVEDQDYWKSVRNIIMSGINTLEPLQQRIFLILLNESATIVEAQKRAGMTTDTVGKYREAYRSGIYKLRRFLERRAKEYDNFGISLRGVGVKSFKENGHTSVVELAVIRRWENAKKRGPVCPLRDV